MESVELSIKTLNLMLGYLAKQPWDAVNPIITAVHAEVGPQMAPSENTEPAIPVGGSEQ